MAIEPELPIPLKAPFPWFGGKSRVASIVWPRLGDVRNYIEPFAGSAAMLLLRPHSPQIETINDKDCFVANFWRATQANPDGVVEYCDQPVNEADLHARHRWLVLSDDAMAFRERMRRDPDYFDLRIAGWWVWGQCCWIGGGWCNQKWMNSGFNLPTDPTELRRPGLSSSDGIHAKRPGLESARGVVKLKAQMPNCPGDSKGRGIFRAGKPVNLSSHDGRGTGIAKTITQQLPDISGDGATGRGIHASAGHSRMMLELAGSCKLRRQWLLAWFGHLRDRLRLVRVCCGDWQRVCGSRSSTTRIGQTAIFLDPPYLDKIDGRHSRDKALYSVDDANVALEVQQYCVQHGQNPSMRIALCGYEGEHNQLERLGWDKLVWRSNGGYANRNTANQNRGRERIWFSPHCLPATSRGEV